jgi:hypothetical protein
MNGLVLGLSKSGKRTLLQRLEGKEPNFLATKTHAARDDLGSRDEATGISTDARYQVPPHLPAFDKAIHLQVYASRKIVDINNGSFDFAVILIDPRHERSKVQKYLSKRIRELIRLLGRRKPLCLIVLRNFCDLIQHANEDALISMSDLTMWTLEVLQDSSMFVETSPLLQCIDTSLLNCYGLSALHHFIYQAYVQRKRYDLQPEWDRMGAAIEESRSKTATLIVPYDEYLSNVERLLYTSSQNSEATPSSSSVGRPQQGRNDDETATTSVSTGTPGGRRRILLPLREESQPARSRTQSGGSSSTLPSIQQSIDHAKDALEAFLESDSDDDENCATMGKHSPMKEESENDASEEDFYLDESGNGDSSSDAADPLVKEMKHVEPTSSRPVSNSATAPDPNQRPMSSESPDEIIREGFVNPVLPVEIVEGDTSPNASPVANHAESEAISGDPIDERADDSSNRSDTLEAQLSKKGDDPKDRDSESDSEFFVEENGATTSADALGHHRGAEKDAEMAIPSVAHDDETQTTSSTENVPVMETAETLAPSSTNMVPDVPAAPVSEISDAARAAVALAQQEFERLMREDNDATVDQPEKKKKKKEKRSGSKKEKKSKSLD